MCGEKPDGTVTETSSTNKMEVIFFSDFSHVDRGFEAEFEAVDASDRKRLSRGQLTTCRNQASDILSSTACPKKFQCNNQRCIKPELKCDGYNDCGDMSDELKCSECCSH